MNSLPHEPAAEDLADDPTGDETSAVRLAMTRALLARSIRNYRDALEFARAVDGAMPEAFGPPWHDDAEPADERQGWHRLHYEADSEFYAAESSLAERINNLYDFLVREDYRIGVIPEGGEFVERAVQLDGVIYSLTCDPSEFEPGKNIIATVQTDRIAGID